MRVVQVRPEIAQSWQRTVSSGLDPGTVIDPGDAVELDPASRLRRSAAPVLDALAEQLHGARYAVVLADKDARLADIRSGLPEMRAVLERVGGVPGCRFTESSTGTNSIATTAELRRGIAVHGEEHFLESLKRFACYGMPIQDPVTRRHAGVLDITCLAVDASPLLRPFLLRSVRDIEAELLGQARRSQRRVLTAFEAASVRTGGPLVGFGADLVLTNDAAADLLQPVDHAMLQTLGQGRGGARGEVELASGLRVGVTVTAVDGGGFLVELQRPGRPAPIPRRTGRTTAVREAHDWHAAVLPDLHRHVEERASVLVCGEPGTGRTTVATQLAGAVAVEPVAGASATVGEVEAAAGRLGGQGCLLVEDAHLLAPEVAARAARLVDDGGLRLVLTAGPDGLPAGERAALGARCPVRLELPPLRAHRDRIPGLAAAVLRGRSAGATRFTPGVLRTLAALDWPGNLRELAMVVGYVCDRRTAGDITGPDLPSGYRTSNEPVAGSLWQAERDAIVRALHSCSGNKVHAARMLGISRTALYRRIRVLHIDTTAGRDRDTTAGRDRDTTAGRDIDTALSCARTVPDAHS